MASIAGLYCDISSERHRCVVCLNNKGCFSGQICAENRQSRLSFPAKIDLLLVSLSRSLGSFSLRKSDQHWLFIQQRFRVRFYCFRCRPCKRDEECDKGLQCSRDGQCRKGNPPCKRVQDCHSEQRKKKKKEGISFVSSSQSVLLSLDPCLPCRERVLLPGPL